MMMMVLPTKKVLGFPREIDFGRPWVSICSNRCLAKVVSDRAPSVRNHRPGGARQNGGDWSLKYSRYTEQ